MRTIINSLFVPLFAALAISCSSPTALQTSEYDDVYYSRSDKTIFQDYAAEKPVNEVAEASVEDDASIANPEYSQNSSSAGSNNASAMRNNGTDYYNPNYYDEDDYYYASRIRRFNAPYRGFSYYDMAYTDAYWYNRSPFNYGRSMHFYDPFYNPVYNPFYTCYTCYGYPGMYGGVSIMIGRTYSPYYNPYYNPFYGGFNQGFYGARYGGGYINSGWYRNDNTLSRPVQYGPRRDRSVVPSGDNDIAPNRPRRDAGSISGGGGVMRPEENGVRPTRSTRGRDAGNTNGSGNNGIISQPDESRSGTRGRIDRSGESTPTERSLDPATIRPDRNQEPGNNRRIFRGRELRPANNSNPLGERIEQPRNLNETPASRTEEAPASRGRRSFEPRNAEDQPRYQPRQRDEQRSQPVYQPRQRETQQRSEPVYQPRQRETFQQPTYQAPQRRESSFSSPSSSPSYNTPSRSSGGGGSFDGGGRSRSRGN